MLINNVLERPRKFVVGSPKSKEQGKVYCSSKHKDLLSDYLPLSINLDLQRDSWYTFIIFNLVFHFPHISKNHPIQSAMLRLMQ